jgi:FtsX-like permease family
VRSHDSLVTHAILAFTVVGVTPAPKAVLGAPLNTMMPTDTHFVISRVGGALASIVGMRGILRACMGVYGMVNYSVAQRTREIGVRMAQVLRLLMVEGFQPIFVGLVVGVVTSAGVSRLFAATLFGPNPMDAVSFFGVSLLLGVIALLATYLPARRRCASSRWWLCVMNSLVQFPSWHAVSRIFNSTVSKFRFVIPALPNLLSKPHNYLFAIPL